MCIRERKTTYSLTAEGENARTLLEILAPQQVENLSDTQKLTVELTSANDEIQSLCFSSKGTLINDAKTPFSYTHLDVYKRQGYGCSGTCSFWQQSNIWECFRSSGEIYSQIIWQQS